VGDALEQIASLQAAVVTVKAYLDDVPCDGPNDLVITSIRDLGDLWWFEWNNGWPLVGRRHHEMPNCHPVAVFKSDGRLLEVVRSYAQWVDGGEEAALEDVREQWRANRWP
jgi:hypothetical protein